MAVKTTYAVKVKARDLTKGKNRTLIFQPLLATVALEESVISFCEKLQPLLTDSIVGAEYYKLSEITDLNVTVPPGVDGLPNSTKDSTIYDLANDVGKKRITIANSASAAESDTAAFNTYANAVYTFGNELTTYYEGDYTVDDVTLRAIFDYEIEQP